MPTPTPTPATDLKESDMTNKIAIAPWVALRSLPLHG